MALALVPHWENRRGRNGDWRGRWPVVLALVVLSATPAFGADHPSQAIVCTTAQIAGAPHPGLAPADFLAPVIGANGNRIIFRSVVGGGPEHGIYLFDVPSGTLTQLTTGDAAGPPNLALGINHDGTRIAFTSAST